MRYLKRLIVGSFAVVVATMAAPGAAQAEVITFIVNEDAVPGADPDLVEANGITGKYSEVLTLDTMTGTFSATLVVQFADYTMTDFTTMPPTTTTVPSQVAAPVLPNGETTDTNLYSLYALVTASGTFSVTVLDGDDADLLPGDGNTLFQFEPTSSTANIYTDPDRDTTLVAGTASTTEPVTSTDTDQHIMTASMLDAPQSFGSVFLCTDVSICGATPFVLTGSYALMYTNPTLVDPDGPIYWPTLDMLSLFYAIASGDVDPTSEGSIFPTAVRGDTSIAFLEVEQVVPEPASLMLLGTGLLGLAARRRRIL